ncbi:MAG: hypothetical protein JST59_18865 [Actinobacteria bacterium]|nr:hypothetical protein [Actinomycetota bacterium]
MTDGDQSEAVVELPPEFDQEALAEAAARFYEVIREPDRVTLTITSDFRDTVRDLVEDEEYAANYEQDREHAFAVAKSIDRSDGSIHVVVYSGVFDRGRPYGSPLPILEHEALHVAVSLRDESLNDLRLRNAGEAMPVPRDIVAMAGVAAEEYRVERVLNSADHEGRESYGASFEDSARRVYRQIARDVEDYQGHLDVHRLAERVLNGFHALATYTGYVAAEIGAAGTTTEDLVVDEEVDDLILGPAWRATLEALVELPPADRPTPRPELDAAAMTIANRLWDWLSAIGFQVREEGGSIHFAVSDPAQWILGPGL